MHTYFILFNMSKRKALILCIIPVWFRTLKNADTQEIHFNFSGKKSEIKFFVASCQKFTERCRIWIQTITLWNYNVSHQSSDTFFKIKLWINGTFKWVGLPVLKKPLHDHYYCSLLVSWVNIVQHISPTMAQYYCAIFNFPFHLI
jgi:hypothetical protein